MGMLIHPTMPVKTGIIFPRFKILEISWLCKRVTHFKSVPKKKSINM